MAGAVKKNDTRCRFGNQALGFFRSGFTKVRPIMFSSFFVYGTA